MKKNTWVFGLLTLLPLCLSVFLTIEAGAKGAELTQLEHLEATIYKANSELTSTLNQKASLSEAEVASERLGYKKVDTIYYVPSPKTFAILP